MAGYSPLYIKGMETGLVQSRQEFILPDDAYPILENAYVWRERIKRKQGFQLLGRLRRLFSGSALGNTNGAGAFTGNLSTKFSLEAGSTIEVGSVIVFDGTNTFTDNGLGVLVGVPGGTGTINYLTGAITITGGAAASPLTVSFGYFPNLPVMGLRSRELNAVNNEMTVAFDTKYAYNYLGGWQELSSGTPTTWSEVDSDFFWTTNYWQDAGNNKFFWATNFSATDPIRYYDGTTWTNFAPIVEGLGGPNEMKLYKCLCILPFRGRLVVFNTFEGTTAGGMGVSIQKYQRIRWSAIGNPIPNAMTGFQPWLSDVRGKGGFLDIPTSEAIVSVGFVRDNLVIYCERSTWQLRYTGRSIAPFQIEKVNSELGAESTFSAVQFDTSLVGVGDKGIVECDSYKSERIDIKIPDLVYLFQNDTTKNGTKRVYGIRDFQNRLAYWIYPYQPTGATFPNRRLVYNYENDSWAIFTDSLTALGTFQPQKSRKWSDFPFTGLQNSPNSWQNQNYPWVDRPSLFPAIIGGNQQGYVLYLDAQVSNSQSLYISAITGHTTTSTTITSPNHNLLEGDIISIDAIPVGTPFDSLNDKVFEVEPIDKDNFNLWVYNSDSGQFNTPRVDPPGTYIGGGVILVRDNFNITSKKFNFLEEGQNIQLGFIDILMNDTDEGAVSLQVYVDYNDSTPVNIGAQNVNNDTFFNSVIETTTTSGLEVTKNWKRIFCPTRGAFITIVWTLSNEQMTNACQESDVQIDAQILWIRKSGRQLPVGV